MEFTDRNSNALQWATEEKPIQVKGSRTDEGNPGDES